MATTRSKLGRTYPTALIQAKDKEFHEQLKQLRLLPSNRQCAECQAQPSTWASVSLGCFVCMNCAQVHRNLGAHISKVKSCMGTYLWCPDEIEQMQRLGNQRVWRCYTGGARTPPQKPAADSPFEVRDAFARDKYERRRWMLPGGMAAVLADERACSPAAQAGATALPSRRDGATAGGGGATGRASASRDAARSRVRQLRAGRRGGGGGGERAPLAEPPTADEASDDWGAFAAWPSPTARPPARGQGGRAPQLPPPPPCAARQGPGGAPQPASLDDFFAQFGIEEAPPRLAPPTTSCAAESTDLINLFGSGADWSLVPPS